MPRLVPNSDGTNENGLRETWSDEARAAAAEARHKMGDRVQVNMPDNRYYGRSGKIVRGYSQYQKNNPNTHTVQFSNKSAAIFRSSDLIGKK